MAIVVSVALSDGREVGSHQADPGVAAAEQLRRIVPGTGRLVEQDREAGQMLVKVAGRVSLERVRDETDPERRHRLVVLARCLLGSEIVDLLRHQSLCAGAAKLAYSCPGELDVLPVVEAGLGERTLRVCHTKRVPAGTRGEHAGVRSLVGLLLVLDGLDGLDGLLEVVESHEVPVDRRLMRLNPFWMGRKQQSAGRRTA